MLDIGLGDGILTSSLAPYFDTVTIVDSNKHILNKLLHKHASDKKYRGVISDAENVRLSEQDYDLAVLSHVLYYVDRSKWNIILSHLYDCLKPGGILVIVLGGDEQGKGRLIEDFGGQNLKIDELATWCQKTFGNNEVSFYASEEVFFAKSLENMLHISSFMLADAKIKADRKELIDYINKHFFKSECLYEMSTKQKYIVIRK